VKPSDNNVATLAEQPFSNEITLAANAVALDPSLVHAVIYVESRYRHTAISPKGAVGLMQVLPDTAARYGLRDKVHLPKGNIKAGTLYLRDLMVMFDNRLDLVLAAYNAGEGAVKKYSRQIPPYPETRHYVKAVMAKYALNAGTPEWSTVNNSSADIKPAELLPVIQSRTKYLAGTDLVISNEVFTLNR
jgi:soluble lytic murein transglycosylase-like protein